MEILVYVKKITIDRYIGMVFSELPNIDIGIYLKNPVSVRLYKIMSVAFADNILNISSTFTS